jgi:transcriptional regulator with XRE-family HTH domain
MKRFGEKLRLLRERRGLSQRQLADLLEVHQSFLWGMEQGRKKPNVDMVLKIADIFGVCIDKLMRDELDLDSELPPDQKESAG